MSSKNLEGAGYQRGMNFDNMDSVQAQNVTRNILDMIRKPGAKLNPFDMIVAAKAQNWRNNNPWTPQADVQVNWGPGRQPITGSGPVSKTPAQVPNFRSPKAPSFFSPALWM